MAVDTVGIPVACAGNHCPRGRQIILCVVDLDGDTGRIAEAGFVGCSVPLIIPARKEYIPSPMFAMGSVERQSCTSHREDVF